MKRTTPSFEDRAGSAALALLLAASLSASGACTGADEPEVDPQVQQAAESILPELEPPPTLPPPIREVPAVSRAKVRVIDPGDGDPNHPASLIEASRRAKARKAAAGPQTQEVVVLNDENLSDFAADGKLMMVEGEPAVAAASSAQAAVGEGSAPGNPDRAATEAGAMDELEARSDDTTRGEAYWSDRALELRMGWRRTIDEIADLELESASLRQSFYAEDDPFIRDNEVKPTWDRVIDRLETLRIQSRRYQRELDSLVSDGRRAGAYQGWLNQGWELEPTDEELRMVDRLSITEIDEPVTRDPVTQDFP